MKLANRTSELNIFRRLIEFKNDFKILLIKAESGYGKSWLLEYFSYHCSSNLSCIIFDLRIPEAYTGSIYLLSQLQRELGIKYFPQYETLIQEFISNKVEVSNNILIGQQNLLQIALNVEDTNLRNLRYERLQNAFFQDLSNLQNPIVLIFDTFQEAPEDLKIWIQGRLLNEIVKLNRIVVVLAGQKVPESTIKWRKYHHLVNLNPIHQVEDWHKFTLSLGMSYKPDEMRLLIQLLKGKPNEIMKAFQALERENQR